jgi:hypothetical protein
MSETLITIDKKRYKYLNELNLNVSIYQVAEYG